MAQPTHHAALDELEHALAAKAKASQSKKLSYAVPTAWTSFTAPPGVTKVNPYEYYLGIVREIRKAVPPAPQAPTGGEWTKNAVIYNMFVRTTCAFDHNGNGSLDLPLSAEGFRETGTFLKALAMLPYISWLGANTVHLLPITAIGHDGNKGSLGSPYAIRNPYELDENLAEPSLGLNVETQFTAFVEAAHILGLRVVVEFVFRTAAKDGDWVKEHPEWMYWIRESVPGRQSGSNDEHAYGSPIFTPDELRQIHHDVNNRQLGNLLPPHQVYRDLFTKPPTTAHVKKHDGRYIGTLEDGTKVKIPGAFADWPPDDNQPPWGDVTYLRMYTHPDFNYIGYNTIRMYDTRLTQDAYVNRPLWDKIIGIIPHYQQHFHIDGVMIDMGHALPMALKAEMVAKARSINPDFSFWDENFSITMKSREEGYNVVFGYLWVDQHHPEKMKNMVRHLSREGFPIPFFATPESHNTPRAAARQHGIAYAKWAMVLNAFLPAVPFIHSGYEIGESFPINTGLDFTNDDLKKYPSETLPLFSEYAYDWLNARSIAGWVKHVLDLRREWSAIVADAHPGSFLMLEDGNPSVIAFARVSHDRSRRIAIVANSNFTEPTDLTLHLENPPVVLEELLSNRKLATEHGVLRTMLAPGECLVFRF